MFRERSSVSYMTLRVEEIAQTVRLPSYGGWGYGQIVISLL